MLIYTLDPFMSPGEIAIVIPGLPIFFEENYVDAERAAQAWIAILERPAAIAPPDEPKPLDNEV
jgi:hypothetical protein